MTQILLIAALLITLFPGIRRRLGRLVWIALTAVLILLIVIASAPR